MPLAGDNDHLRLLLTRLQKLPDHFPEVVAEAVPTLGKLLSHASTTSPVNPRNVPFAARKYEVDEADQAWIDQNTVVEQVGPALHVTTAGGNPHLRPLIPVGELPLKWRGALAAKIKGGIRRRLKAQGLYVSPGGPRNVAELQASLRRAGR